MSNKPFHIKYPDSKKRVFLLLTSLILVVFAVIAPLQHTNAQIIPGELMTILNKGISRLDQDVDDCVESGIPEGKEITWIGDSLSVNAQLQIQSQFPGVDIHAKVSKQFAIDTDNNPSGVSVLKDLGHDLRKYIVFALGTNGDFSQNAIDEVVSYASSQDKIIVFVTNFANGPKEANNNKMFAAEESNDNVAVADWAKVASNYVAQDRTHIASDIGKEIFIDTIYSALSHFFQGSGSDGMVGNTNLARIANWLAGGDRKLNAKAAAGIIANFMHESGLNPFRNQSQFNESTGNMNDNNGYGLAQFTPRTKVLPTLQSDSRTSAYYPQWYSQGRHGGSVTKEDGYMPPGVPVEVNNAWLLVQLEFFWSSEMETTTLESYRHVGGEMGLDYLSDSLTIAEAISEAKDEKDAARIFVWIYERPADKEGAAQTRSETATSILDEVSSAIGSYECSTPVNNGEIAQHAINLSWPDDSNPDVIKPEYFDALEQDDSPTTLSYAQDCGHFVATVMRTSGVDSDFPKAGTSTIANYMEKSELYKPVPNTNSTDDLQPGDIFVVNQGSGNGTKGHIFIYVGTQLNGVNIAQASLGTHTGYLSHIIFNDSRGTYEIYRFIGGVDV